MSWKHCNLKWKCRSTMDAGQHVHTHTHNLNEAVLFACPLTLLIQEGCLVGVKEREEAVILCCVYLVIGLSAFVYPS